MVVGLSPDVDTDRLFGALSDATRRDILARTLERGESISSLARRYAMSFAAVQKHVAVLERATLVTKERRGREQLVHGNEAGLDRARRLLDEYEQVWRARVRRIEQVLDERGGER